MAGLSACPFCRALYAAGESRLCPECGVKLVAMENLPPSLDVVADEAEFGEIVLPEQRALPWNYFGSMRGVLLILAVLGLVAFFTPWVQVRMPDMDVRSGFDLARGRAGWLWGGAAGWLVMLPLVWSRRTIQRMRGVRFVTVLLAAMTLVETLMLLSMPPRASHHLPVQIEWRWGLYLSLVTSALGILAALRFGGDLKHLPQIVTDLASSPSETSSGRTLH